MKSKKNLTGIQRDIGHFNNSLKKDKTTDEIYARGR